MLSQEERVAALYMRVMHRVRVRFEKQTRTTDDETRDEEEAGRLRVLDAAARVEQRWCERLTCYTGYTYVIPVEAHESADEQGAADGGSVSAPGETSPSHGLAIRGGLELSGTNVDGLLRQLPMGMGQPHTLMQMATPSSVYAKMLNAKRKIDQLDGTTEDDDGDGGNPSGQREQTEGSLAEGTASTLSPLGTAAATTSTLSPLGTAAATTSATPAASLAASSSSPSTSVALSLREPSPSPSLSVDVAHVASLSIARFPLQCSACDSSFRFKKRNFHGKWKNAVITLLRHVNRLEQIAPGHLLWLTRPPFEIQSASSSIDSSSADCGDQRSNVRRHMGSMVDVVESPRSDGMVVVRVGQQDTQTLTVHVTETRRFQEWIVADCSVRFQFLHS